MEVQGQILFLFLGLQLIIILVLYNQDYKRRNSYVLNIPTMHEPTQLLTMPIPSILTKKSVSNNLNQSQQLELPREMLPTCPQNSPLIVGPLEVNLPVNLTLDEIAQENPLVQLGGHYQPPNCSAVYHTAIIIPYRARRKHLQHLLYHLHPFLQRQQIHYTIYVVHQMDNFTFNRAKLLNVGYREAMKENDWTCIYFHDVDMIPEDDRNIYHCNAFPLHAAAAIDKFKYKLPYSRYFGGVIALQPSHYMTINGFSNNYWGWGGEDDDIATRIFLNGLLISRPPVLFGRYHMLKHDRDKGNKINTLRFHLLARTRFRWRYDGMNTLVYTLLSRTQTPLYTNLTVNLGLNN